MQIRRGVRGAEAAEILREFFRWRRTQSGFSEREVPVPPQDIMLV